MASSCTVVSIILVSQLLLGFEIKLYEKTKFRRMAYLTQFKGKVLNGGEITALEN